MQKQRRIFVGETDAREQKSQQAAVQRDMGRNLLRFSGLGWFNSLRKGRLPVRQYTFEAGVLGRWWCENDFSG